MKIFKNANVYVGGKGITKTDLVFGKEIVSTEETQDDGEIIDLPESAVVVPAFIDIHVHGADGADAMDGTTAALNTIDNALAREGVSRFLATTMTQSKQNIVKALKACGEYAKGENGLLGIHLEGPFISNEYKGAHPEEYIHEPDVKLFSQFYSASHKTIKTVTLASETEGAEALIKHLVNLGVKVSLGHTGASCAQIEEAMRLGADVITHTFNAQLGIHHREIGTAGAALLYDGLYTELIADGNHVSKQAMQLLVKTKPHDKLILITDAIRAKGLADGESELGGQTVFVKNGEARLKDGTLAGSVLKMNNAVKNLMNIASISLERAVDCASLNPAKHLGLDKLGSIKPGNTADLTVLSQNLEVLLTVRNGEIIYSAN